MDPEMDGKGLNLEREQSKKRLYGFLMAFLIIAVETAIMTYVWVNFYNTELPKAYYFWGHVFITAVYMALLFIASGMYGGLKIGSYRMIELMFSESIATIVTNVVFYAIICLLAYHFPTPVPLRRISKKAGNASASCWKTFRSC